MKTRLIAVALLAGSSLFAQVRFYAGARIGYRRPGTRRDVRRSARPACHIRDTHAWTGLHVCGRLLVSRRTALRLACRILDSPCVCRRLLGRPALCHRPVLRRLLARR